MPVNDLRPSPHISTTALLTLTGNFAPSICTSLFDLLPCLLLFFKLFIYFFKFDIHLVFKSVAGVSGNAGIIWSFDINDPARVRPGRSKSKENKADSSGTPLRVLLRCQ